MLERRQETLPASGILQVGRANYFILLTASASVNMELHRDGTSERFNGMTGGIRIQRVNPWYETRIIGAAGTVVTYITGTENIAEDDTSIFTQVSSITGAVTTQEAPASSVTDAAPVVVATATEAVLFGTGPTRRRITVFCDSANPGSCFARPAGASTNNIVELQPGVSYTFAGTYALDVRNDTGGNCTFYRLEEL